MSMKAWAAQQAIYDLLSSASPAVCAGGFHNARPKPADTTYPLAVLYSTQVIPDDVSTEVDGEGDTGVSEFYDVHVYDQVTSGVRGDKNLRQALDRLHELLHGAAIAVADRASAHAWIRNVVKFTEADDVTEHMVVSVEVVHRD